MNVSGSMTVLELKDKILYLAVNSPRACGNATRRLVAQRDGLRKLAIACDSIGLSYARQVFDRISPSQWSAMENILRERTYGPGDGVTEGQALVQVYTAILGETMTADESRETEEDPFHFLQNVPEEALSELLRNENPAQIAFISLFWSPDEMNRVFDAVPPGVRRQIVLQISRLQRLPEDAVERVAALFADSLRRRLMEREAPANRVPETRRETPAPRSAPSREVRVSDSEVAAAIHRIVSGIDFTADRKIREYLKKASPGLGEKLEALPSLESTALVRQGAESAGAREASE